MSLDISIRHRETGDSRDMNWLRNPFGLEHWAEANYRYATRKEAASALPTGSLWHVINDHAYDDSERVERSLFLTVVKTYVDVLNDLERGYFWFDVSGYKQFVQPHVDLMPEYPIRWNGVSIGGYHIKDEINFEQQVGLPMEYFGHPAFELSNRYRPDAHTLARYKAWFAELVEFAELLQDSAYEYHCSN